MEIKVCRRNKYGYCKYGETCHFRHEKEICIQNNCNIFDCERRHPKVCKWYLEYGRCKFSSYCKFRHTNIKNFEEIVNKIELNAKKLAEIDKRIVNFEKEEGDIMNKSKTSENLLEKRLEVFETKLNEIFKIMGEKDLKITELEASLQLTRESLEKLISENEMKKTSEAPNSKFKCSFCDYQAKSSNGLRMHINRKHTKYDENKTSFQCENCGKEFSSACDLKDHMISHSFQKLQFKCDECDFWGPNKQTMKMHIKRNHSEIITCGMCDFEAKDIEILDTHTFTCEMYKCNDMECGKSFLILNDLKSHMNSEHHGLSAISHFKRHLSNQEFFDESFHFVSDLFGNE